VSDPVTVLASVGVELQRATAKFGPFNSAHEGYAVIAEELDELWGDVKANRLDAALREAVQVAAMAVRFIVDLSGAGSEPKGRPWRVEFMAE
jgi:hypothetical protein